MGEQTRSSSQTGEDRIAARLRVGHLLNTVSLETPWLPPTSTLIVRKFRDPLPRGLCKDADLRFASRDWENAALSALREESLHAARPALGSVAGATNAVLFESPADLIACLARDLCSGDAFLCWWWKSYIRGVTSSLSALLLAAFRREPRHVPMAVEKLSHWGATERVISQLNPSHADSLLREILSAHGLPRLFTAIHSGTSEIQASCTTADRGLFKLAPASDHFLQPPALPWAPHVSAQLTPSYLGLERRVLIGISLLLARTPQRPRTAEFENQLKKWAASSAHEQEISPLGATAGNDALFPWFAGTPSRIEILPREKPSDSAVQCVQSSDGGETSITQVERSSPNAGTDDAAISLTEPDSSIPTDGVFSASDFNLQAGVVTRLGGVLFLINLFRNLNFFSYVETSLPLASPPGPWALLELFSKSLLPRLPDDLRRDPIWLALQTLDGRGRDEPAAGDFSGCEEYQLPRDWLFQIPAQQQGCLTFSARENRLLVRYPEGFTVFDSIAEELKIGPSPRRILERIQNTFSGECRYGRPTRDSRRKIASLSGTVPAECVPNPALRRFLQFFSPFFRWTLTHALAPGETNHPHGIPEFLRRPGCLYITSTHVDLVMDINHVTLATRLAGLDANPGWVPELGRAITFHYR